MPRSPSPQRDREHRSDHRREDDRDRHRERRRGRSRSRSRSRSPRPRRRSSSSSGSRHRHRRHRRRSTSSYASSESEEERRRRRRKDRERRDSRSRSRSRDRRESKEERRERKRLKREKKEKKKARKEARAGKKAVIGEYGRYGIISEADMYSKDQEYRAWLVEEKMLNPETVPPSKMKELFRAYMEDYNTGTLPHEKYYALEAYERRMNAIKAGETLPDESSYDPRADELALSSASRARASKVAAADSYLVREQVEALRKLERERTEASRMKRMGMDVKESMGVRYE